MAEYGRIPVEVARIETAHRRICTALPVPASLPIFEALAACEPRSMGGQPPVVWDRAVDCTVMDRWGNRWIDWSSGVLIANCGHGHPAILAALRECLDQELLTTYVFVHQRRVELTRRLREKAPDPEGSHVFLLSTGSEATENCIKLAKTYALEKHGRQRRVMVTFNNAFHGRTLGAQLAGGNPRQKHWIACGCPDFVQVPFPDGFKNPDTSFDLFLGTLRDRGISPGQIAGVMSESYQGCGPDFLPVDYARKLEAFCREHDIVLIMDEVQAGFGRTGKFWCFEHYGIKPDLIACGKGISSSLPIAAVIGRQEIMGLYAPGSMTSTHSGSPLPVAAAIANLQVIETERLVERAAAMGGVLIPELQRIRDKYPEVLGCVAGKGLVAGIQVVKPGSKEPNPELALAVNVKCFHKGLLMFAPVGVAGECLKICPPLTMSREMLEEAIQVFEEAIDDVLGQRN